MGKTMIENLSGLWQFEFMRHAFMTGLLVSVACGIIGTFVVVKRIVFLSGGISHTAYGGIGLGYFFGFNPIFGAVIFSLFAALGIAWVRHHASQREDTLIGIMWAMGMAFGIFFIDKTPGYAPNLMSYLFGNILTVPTTDLIMIAIMDLVILIIAFSFFKEFKALAFDEEHATISGLPVIALNILLFCLIALTVVVLIRAVGIILVIALLTIPAASIVQYRLSLERTMAYAIVLGAIFTTVGLVISAAFNITSGATIIMLACLGYLISLALRPLILRTSE
jgi:zinc transport system permease protein